MGATEDLVNGFDRMARESAHRRANDGAGTAAAAGDLQRRGVAPSTAKKRVRAEADALAEAERREQAERQNTLAEALRIAARARRDR